MDSTVLAVLVGAVRGGCRGAVRPVADRAGAGPGSRRPLSPRSPKRPPSPPPPVEPPEPYADIARLPGLGWRSAVAARSPARSSGAPSAGLGAACSGCRSSRSCVALARHRLAHPPAADGRDPPASRSWSLVLVLVGGAGDRGPGGAGALRSWLVSSRSSASSWCSGSTRGAWGSATSGWPGVLGLALGWLGWGTLVVGLYSGFLLGGLIGGAARRCSRVVDRQGHTRSGRSCWSARCSACSGAPTSGAVS